MCIGGRIVVLRVEKKSKSGRRPFLPLLLAALTILTGISLLFAFSREEPEKPVQSSGRGTILQRKTEDINRIRIQMRGRKAWTAVRNERGEMTMEGAEGWSIDPTLGERLLDALANLSYESILTENPEDYRTRLKEFGLEDPALTAEVLFSDKTEVSLKIGDKTGIEDQELRYMIIDGDDRLFAVAGSMMEDLGVEAELLHPVEQPEIQLSRMDRITILDSAGSTKAEWSLQGNITDADASASWRVNYPVTYPADQDRMNALRKNAGNIRLGIYISEGTEKMLAAYGLDKPRCEIVIHLAEGTTGSIMEDGTYDVRAREEESFRFKIGNARNEMTDYCLYRERIYTINHFTLAALTETDPMETLARYPVSIETDQLSRMVIEQENGTRDVFELTYSEVGTEESSATENKNTVVRCTKNGEEFPYEVFAAVYERMRTVSFSGRLPEGWKKKKTQTRYSFQSVSGQIHTVELSEFDRLHDAVTVDGATLFYLIRGGMGESP